MGACFLGISRRHPGKLIIERKTALIRLSHQLPSAAKTLVVTVSTTSCQTELESAMQNPPTPRMQEGLSLTSNELNESTADSPCLQIETLKPEASTLPVTRKANLHH